MSVVRDNLMSRAGYSPYCGNGACKYRWPRTHFDGEQFKCGCGWRSNFEAEFITAYKAKWHSDHSDDTPPARKAERWSEGNAR